MGLLFDKSPPCRFDELSARHAGCTVCESQPLSSALLATRTGCSSPPVSPELFDPACPVRLRAALLTEALSAGDLTDAYGLFIRLGACGPEQHCDLIVFATLEYGLEVFAPLVNAVAAAGWPALEVLARQVIGSVVGFEGPAADRWSPAARWLTSSVAGFLPRASVVRELPVGELMGVRLPGFAPCPTPLVFSCWEGLGADGREVFARLIDDWSGSLESLLVASRLLGDDPPDTAVHVSG